MTPPRAVLFDFNGTLSHDEPILCEIFLDLFAEHGIPLSAQQYFDRLAGLSDPEIVTTWLGPDHPALDAVLAERVRRYQAAVADGSTVPAAVRAAVRFTAERVPVGVVSGAALEEIEPVLEASGLAGVLETIVSSDDVLRGKPDPEGYLKALAFLDGDIKASEVLVFEDTEAGVVSAKGAGMRCLAVLGTLAPERLIAADEIVPALDLDLMRRLL
jgi:beta-phosphoglucomutase-like phosphatase (HAD superfamily)